jgi:hypothetical protein
MIHEKRAEPWQLSVRLIHGFDAGPFPSVLFGLQKGSLGAVKIAHQRARTFDRKTADVTVLGETRGIIV